MSATTVTSSNFIINLHILLKYNMVSVVRFANADKFSKKAIDMLSSHQLLLGFEGELFNNDILSFTIGEK